MRENIGELDSGSRAFQLSSELMQMNSNPQKWDHDDVHGEMLQFYQKLSKEKNPNKQETIDNVVESFRKSAAKENASLIQDFANQSPWKNTPANIVHPPLQAFL